ncbi:phosphopantetheine-binding protein [Ciceribacter sp. RN22]|uniref:phosphopantetheine-binding protein n=1 Tax=Ciceribacter sp. RN22 TaxID=2954932 RepID=UPI0020936284|nr:phosphopantetheine-binding protein [Ciceribacter sp. RN22]MCO6179729.1 phosphopantetheine-binding protein [Ciceribacter sp. RN22]
MADFTIETLRRDIARMIHVDPSEIGTGDNLMDLGLDSMRAMALVLSWEQQGLKLDFSELAADVTLAGWWAVIARQQDMERT